jgi:hypothetical protein
VILTVRAINAFFKHSSQWRYQLAVQMKKVGVTRGLVSIGNTCFHSIWSSSCAIKHILPALSVLVEHGLEITGNPDMRVLMSDETKGMEFSLLLTRYVDILQPCSTALKCMESSSLSLAEVCLFYLATSASMAEYLAQDEDGIPREVKKKIWLITNKRFNQMLHKAPSDTYLVCFWLHPGKLNIFSNDWNWLTNIFSLLGNNPPPS